MDTSKQGLTIVSRRSMLATALLAMVLIPACDHGSIVGSCLSLDDFRNCKGGPIDVDEPCGGGGSASSSSATGGGEPSTGGSGGCETGKDYACYNGPSGTRGVGDCADGKHKCLADRMSYGPCLGATLPKPEDPTKAGDEDCDGHASSETLWAENFGDGSTQKARGVAIDSKGNEIIAGIFSGGMKIGSDTLVSTPTSDSFVAKFDPKGKPIWAKQLPGDIAIYAVARDSKDAIFVAGSWSTANGPVALGNASGNGPIFVAKLDPDGKPIWSRGCGGSSLSGATLSTGPNDEVVLGGVFKGSADCGSGAFTETSGGSAGFVAHFSNDGTSNWAMSLAAGHANELSVVVSTAIDPAGTVWFTGYLQVAANVGSYSFVAAGTKADMLLAHLSPTGAIIRADQYEMLAAINMASRSRSM